MPQHIRDSSITFLNDGIKTNVIAEMSTQHLVLAPVSPEGELFANIQPNPTDVRKHTVESLKVAPIGDGHHGRDFYKYFLVTHPDHRRFYKGAENYIGENVSESERFDELGNSVLLFVHVLANTVDNESVFRAYVRRVMFEHSERSINPALWKHFWEYWTGFLESKGASLSAEEKSAWKILGAMFSHECQTYLTVMERLHA